MIRSRDKRLWDRLRIFLRNLPTMGVRENKCASRHDPFWRIPTKDHGYVRYSARNGVNGGGGGGGWVGALGAWFLGALVVGYQR